MSEKVTKAAHHASDAGKAESLTVGCVASFCLQRTFDLNISRFRSCAPAPEAELGKFGIFIPGAPIGNTLAY